MVNYEELASKLKAILGVDCEPVAVTLLKSQTEIPDGYSVPEKSISHCQSIMRARNGEMLYVPADKHGCPVGASSLGLLPIPDKVASGEFHHNIGMFETPAAAKGMIDERQELEPGSVLATLVAPLSKAGMEPDVVVISGLPEQLYWIIVASTFKKGGRMKFDTAAFQATCVDSILIPLMTGRPNLSLGCYGCRRRTDIRPEEMVASIPFSMLEEIVEALEQLSVGPIPKARGG